MIARTVERDGSIWMLAIPGYHPLVPLDEVYGSEILLSNGVGFRILRHGHFTKRLQTHVPAIDLK